MQTSDRACLRTLADGLLVHHIDDVSAEWIAQQGENLNLKTGIASDSITLAEVAFAIEELFEVSMNNQDLAEMETLHDLANFIERKRSAK
nr:acyl carrier protein [Cerasicoccus arenae]